MRNLKNIIIMLLIGLFAVGFFSSCAEADTGTSYTDEEKAVLINKAITEGGTTARSVSGTERIIARPVTDGALSVINTVTGDDFKGSQFYSTDINTWGSSPPVLYYDLIYKNLTITVQDSSKNAVIVIINGSINYGFYMAADKSLTVIFFGTLTGSVDGDSFASKMDLKTRVSSDGSTSTVTGTVGDSTINETY